MSDDMSNGLTNGISNGSFEGQNHEKHKEHKHKSKDRDRDRHKSSHKDKDREKSKSRDKDRHSSHKSSHKDKDKDRERHRERSDKDRDKHKERSDRDKHKDKERSHDKDRSDKHKDRSKDKERSRDDKDRSKDKHRSREDKDRKSSSDKKDRHSSSHKRSHKDKHRERSQEISPKKEPKIEEVNYPVSSSDEFVNEMREEPEEKIIIQEEYIKEEPVDSEEDQLVIKEEPVEISQEENEDDEEEDELPLAARRKIKVKEEEDFKLSEDDDDEDKPLMSRKKIKPTKKRVKMEDEEEDFKPDKKKLKKEKKIKREKPYPEPTPSPKKKKKDEEQENVWKWWEEEKRDDGKKWNFLEHKGPYFPEPYERLPKSVKFYYNKEHFVLSDAAEEVAGFYARMLVHDYCTKDTFNDNFFRDWRKNMTSKEREKLINLKKCDFSHMHAYFIQKNEERKNRSKEEKKALKEENQKIVDEYGWCNIDGHKQRIGNFKIEPPGLFRGRGEHPRMGMLKKRIQPEDIIINCSKDSDRPKPPPGHKWKEVRSDPNVTWLACWVENVQGQFKYVMLNAASKLKGEKDWQKYETARRLHRIVDKIRETYRADWKSREMRIRQRSVALYFIDKLALRAGNEKDEDQADTVGCCSLRVEHISLHEKKDGKEYVVVFDFLGKDSIRYYNEVQVEKKVFKNLQLFMESKEGGDDLFDRLNTAIMNKHLNELMEGLTAKVFRTYNASRTLQEQLLKLTNEDDPIPAKILSYNRANREVAILCNHQRAVPKTFEKSMANLQTKIDDKRKAIEDTEYELKDAKKAAKHGGSMKEKSVYDKKKKALERLKDQLCKLEISATDKEENKQIALGTSKLNYLDPRISVAWCKKFNVPLEKCYNKTQRQKFQWAIDMATADYNFLDEPAAVNTTRNSEDGDCDEDEY